MTTYRLTIADMGIGGLYLGTTNELEHTQIMIDIGEWAQELESGATIGLVFTSPDGTAETIPYTMEGTNVILSPTSDGFYMPGVGEIEIMLIGAKGSIMVKATNETIVEAAPMMRSSAAGMPVMAAMPATVPATRESVDDSQDERLNKLPHVTVSGRDLSIPNGIQEISVRGDSKSVRVVFHVPRYYDGIDLGMRSFFVEILNPLNQFDTVIPSTQIEEDEIITTWEVQRKHAAVAGQIKVKLKATENGDYIWQTHTGYFTVTDTFDDGSEHIPEATITAIDAAVEETLEAKNQAVEAANSAQEANAQAQTAAMQAVAAAAQTQTAAQQAQTERIGAQEAAQNALAESTNAQSAANSAQEGKESAQAAAQQAQAERIGAQEAAQNAAAEKEAAIAASARAETAANRAEGSAQSIQEAQDMMQRFEDTGLIMVDGKLCVQVERSESV